MNEHWLSPTERHEFIDIQVGKSELARGMGDNEHYQGPGAALESTESDEEVPQLTDTSDSASGTESDSDESVDDHEHNLVETSLLWQHRTKMDMLKGLTKLAENKIEDDMFDSDAENASEKVMNEDSSSTEGPTQICFVQEVQKAMTEGSHAYLGGQMKIAVSHYQKALSILSSSRVASQLTILEVTILKYALGVSSVAIGNIKNFTDGMRCFQQILDEHTSEADLLFIGHYGMLSAFYRQNRFTDALQPLEACLPLLDKNLSFIPCNWPGTDIVIDDFSSVKSLKDHLDELLHICKTPPIPDAVCRFPECDGHFKPQIYLTDSDFQGFVSVHCEERCTVEYHQDCWRRVRSLKKHTDKEMLNTECVTPDCQGLVVRIRFIGPDGGVTKEVPADSEAKPKKHSSKAQKQHAKTSKGQKKEKMPKEKTAKSDLQSRRNNASSERERSVDSVKSDKPKCASETTASLSNAESNAGTGANSTDHSQKTLQMLPPDATNFVAIQKKTTDDNDFVGVKKKAKRTRDRPRPVTVFLDQFNQNEPAVEQPDDGRFSPPFTFAARNMAAWHGEQAQTEFWDVPFISYDNVKTLPSSRETIKNETYSSMRRRAGGEAASYQQNSASDFFKPLPDRNLKDEADVRANIISIFLKLLEENGPAHPDDAIVQNELAKLPAEDQLMICQAGGIAKMLQKEIKFAVVDGYLCVTQDMTRARQMAQSRRQALLASIASPGSSVQPVKLNGPPGAGILPPKSALLDSLPQKSASVGLAPPKSALFSSLQMNSASSGSGISNSYQLSEVPLFPPVKPTLNSMSQLTAMTPPSQPNLAGFGPSAAPVVAVASELQTINATSKAKVDAAISSTISSVVREDDSMKTKLAELWSNPKPVAAASSAMSSVLTNNAARYPLSSSAGMQNAWLESSFSRAPSSYSSPVISQSNALYTRSSIHSGIPSTTNEALNSGDSAAVRSCVVPAEGPIVCAISSDYYGGKVLPIETAETIPSSKLKNFFSPDPTVDSNASLPNSCGDSESRFHEVFKVQADEKLLGTCSMDDIDDVYSGNELDAVYDSDENVNNVGALAQFYPTNTDVDFDMAGLGSNDNQTQVAASGRNLPSTKTTTGLSVTAPSFIYPAEKLSILCSGQSSATMTTVSSELAEMPKTFHPGDKISTSTQTAEDWNREITKLHAVVEAMKQEHNTERNKLLQRIEDADSKLRLTEQQYDGEKLALAAAWKKEKLSFESRVEKLQQELNSVKANYERACSKILSVERELHEKTLLLLQEQEKSAALRAEIDTQKKLKELYESKPGGAATFQPASFGSGAYQSFMSGSAINPRLVRPPVTRPTYLSNGPVTTAGAVGPLQSLMTQPTAKALAVEKPATSSAEGVKSKQSYSKIVTALNAIFPEMTNTELTKCIEEVRAARNNTLSGLTMQQIVFLVSNEVLKQKMLTQNASNVSSAVNPITFALSAGALSRPSSQLGLGSSHSGSVAGDRDLFDDEDPCIICHEELTVGETSKLDCGHEFHTECIRKWFKEQNTCPTCRNHALLPDDFPSLTTVYRYPRLQNDRGNFR